MKKLMLVLFTLFLGLLMWRCIPILEKPKLSGGEWLSVDERQEIYDLIVKEVNINFSGIDLMAILRFLIEQPTKRIIIYTPNGETSGTVVSVSYSFDTYYPPWEDDLLLEKDNGKWYLKPKDSSNSDNFLHVENQPTNHLTSQP